MDRRGFLATLGAVALGGCLDGTEGAARTVTTTGTGTGTPSPTPTAAYTDTATPTPTATSTPTETPTASPTATAAASDPSTPTATPIATPTGNRAAPIVFEGEGERNTGAFEVAGRGPELLTLAHDGSSTFSVWLLNGGAEPLEILANAGGPYRGRLLRGLDPGTYRLAVESNGDWRIRLDQRRPPERGVALPIEREGQGSVPVGPAAFEDGTWLSVSAADAVPYTVWLRDAFGDPVERLVDGRGPFDDRTTAFNATGPGYLAVETTGGWALSAGNT